jgi:putative DNA primase/helicase
MGDFITEFAEALRTAGFEPKNEIIADDKWHQAFYMGEKKPSGAYSLKICENGFAIGCFFTRKEPDKKYKWHSKTDEKISPEQREKLNEEIKQKRKKKQIAEDRRQRRLADRLTKVYKALPKAQTHSYLTKKKIQSHDIKFRKKTGELVIPLYGVDGKVWSVQKINAKGGKYLFTGGKKQGCYFPICSSKEDLSLFLVYEGFATAASGREATGLPTICCFDSGNLEHVLKNLKKKYPKSKFVICADNDAFTKNPKGESWNVGIEAAKKASAAIGGAFVVSPDFSKLEDAVYQKEKPTDFNDLHQLLGLQEVKNQLMSAVDRIPAKQEEPAVVSSPPQSQPSNGSTHEKEFSTIDQHNFRFKVLGYDEGTYYFFPHAEKQIVALTAQQLGSLANLLRLETYQAWKVVYGGDDAKVSDRKIITDAMNALMITARQKGVFRSQDQIRGCGAWLDEGRVILHCGDILYVDGVKTKFEDIDTKFTYVASAKLMRPAETPLTNKEAYILRQICERITWENDLSAQLLAGWLVIAPICGLLEFRPHIWITGEAESGKSTVLDSIIKPLLGKIAFEADGGTTEPSIRRDMAHDARPLIYDEAEKSHSMENVIELARKATNGKVIRKYGQQTTRARFCACFGGINPPVEKVADETRISFLTIRKNLRPTAMAEYAELMDVIEDTITEEYSNKLLARTLKNIHTLRENIKVFERATRKAVKSARASQLIGAMLAGSYLLTCEKVISQEFADKWVAERDWTSHALIDDETDPTRLLQYIASAVLRINHKGQNKEYSIGDLITMAHTQDEDADKNLRYHGISVKEGKVYIANRSQNLQKVLRDTDWSSRWTKMLSNLEGAESFRTCYFSAGFKTSGVSLPISLFDESKLYEPAPEPIQQELEALKEKFEMEIPF